MPSADKELGDAKKLIPPAIKQNITSTAAGSGADSSLQLDVRSSPNQPENVTGAMREVHGDGQDVFEDDRAKGLMRFHPMFWFFGFVITIGIVEALMIAVINMLFRRKLISQERKNQVGALKRAVPLGIAICFIVAVTSHRYAPKYLSPASAVISIVIVVEMQTIDRFITKAVFRVCGTLAGALESALTILLVHYSNQQPVVVFASICLVTVPNACLQYQLTTSHGYVFMCSNITFGFVFFAYFKGGGLEVALNRVLSIFTGVFAAVVVEVFWPLILRDQYALSLDTVVESTNAVVRKTLAIVDFTFVHDGLLAMEVVDKTLPAFTLWQERPFSPDTAKFFDMENQKTTIGELMAHIGENAHGKKLENEEQVAQTLARAKAAWNELVVSRYFTCRAPPRHNFSLLATKLHPVYGQACSLSHMAYSSISTQSKEFWNQNMENIERIRVAFLKLHGPLLELVSKCGLDSTDSSDVENAIRRVAVCLEEADEACITMLSGHASESWTTTKALNKFERSTPLSGGQLTCQWRFAFFVQTANYIVAEFAAYLLIIKENWLPKRTEGEGEDELQERLETLVKHEDS
eukprot:gnl/TRDRNA2_/TRDRNA2_136828_c0_seq1.p1 gnl/TRDRNA2_/TRDRNA2_136828_c0~~gnl/TRDRNA2_/TRDRNA2_136828_c0_seq1.p1  ORF type:complete len:674 (+),score=104.67 gnl/TRDRNA2_/TRDRNA2_136828_c0_seq1:284-2023(+)